jgi:hypothetical protein
MAASRKLRAERRTNARRSAKDIRDRERLVTLEAGGAPGHPVEVVSASLVELKARGLPCPVCGAAVRVDDHTAKTIDGVALRLAHILCPMCSHARIMYFTIRPPLAN